MMGPHIPLYESFAKILFDVLPDRAITDSHGQSTLVYLMIKEKDKWGGNIYIENDFFFKDFGWILSRIMRISVRDTRKIEAEHIELRHRYAEKIARLYAGKR